jgi:hypothetical protein
MVFENIPTYQIVLFIVFLVFFLLIGIVLLIWLNYRYKWPYKVTVLENVAGQGFIPSFKDRARLVSFGDGGEEIFFLRKKKKYKIGYGKYIGKRAIAWAIGDDGYWYNVTFGNVNKTLQELGLDPVDRDVRYATASVRKGLDLDYKQKTFFEKWAVPITIGMLIFAMLINGGGMYYVLDKQKETALATATSVETSARVMELAKEVLAQIDVVASGSGLQGG